MPRKIRVDIGNQFYHVLNRANKKEKIFLSAKDYYSFEYLMKMSIRKTKMRVLAYCIMPNHFHFLLHPRNDGDLAKFMKHLTQNHTQAWHKFKNDIGTGHLYQGRYKSFHIKNDIYLKIAHRYIEQNPLRANLVKDPTKWKWSSLSKRLSNTGGEILSNLPYELGSDYIEDLKKPLSLKEREIISQKRPKKALKIRKK